MPRLEDLLKLHAAEPHDPFVLYGLAQEYAKAGDTAAAIHHYDLCLQHDPTYLYAYYHKARALGDAGDKAAARKSAQAGLDAAKKANDLHAASELRVLVEEFS